jgi:hypothetical protein
MVEIEKKLAEMGLELPKVPMDMRNWVRCKRAGNLVFIGTTGPWPLINRGESDSAKGAIGREITLEKGKEISKMCALSILGALKTELGDLDKIDNIVKVEVNVGIATKSDEHIGWRAGSFGGEAVEIANTACDLFVDLFGERGKGTRSIIPALENVPVELDVIVSIKD